MQAGIIAVGSELLGTDRLDSNSLLLTAILQRYGVGVRRKSVVGDVVEEIAAELEGMVRELDLILVTGGLGPTSDDVTREAAARALGRGLILDETLLRELQAKFEGWSRRMPEVNKRQAEMIEGAEALANPRGTAPGIQIQHQGATIFLFPGVPAELRGLIESALEPWLRERSDGERLETRILRVACIAESALEEKIRPVYDEFDRHEISVLASPGDVQIRLQVKGSERGRRRRLEAMTDRLQQLLEASVYATGAATSLEEVVVELLASRQATLATAESCTGGLLSERLTRIPGSSACFLGGVIAYSNKLKEQLLGVSREALERFGAVSREVVIQMAEGVVERLGSRYGLAVSGIAGPAGGSSEKPVGTVHVALGERGGATGHRELHLPGGRERVRWLASQWMLEMLRRRLRFDGEAG